MPPSSRCPRPATRSRSSRTRRAARRIEQAPVPGATTKPHGPQIPAGANRTLQQFVQAQVGQNGQPDLATLGRAERTRRWTSRRTRRRTSAGPTSSAPTSTEGVVGASIELIVDPNAGHTTTRVASETLLLAQGPSGGYVVTSATHLAAPRRVRGAARRAGELEHRERRHHAPGELRQRPQSGHRRERDLGRSPRPGRRCLRRPSTTPTRAPPR